MQRFRRCDHLIRQNMPLDLGTLCNVHRPGSDLMRAIFVDCTPELRRVIEKQGLRGQSSITINDGNPSERDLAALCRGAEVILVEHTLLPSSIFDICPSIRAVIFMGTGAGTYVDLDDVGRRNIRVVTTPGYGDRAVAEHALALMLSAARNVARMDRVHPCRAMVADGRSAASGPEARHSRIGRNRIYPRGHGLSTGHESFRLEPDSTRSP